MHNVVFRKDDSKKTLEMVAHGHAGTAKKGENIVCAACSILAYTLAQNVIYCAMEGLCAKPEVKIDDEGANILVRVKTKGKADYARLLNIYLSLSLGYVILQHNYPDQVRVKTLNEE